MKHTKPAIVLMAALALLLSLAGCGESRSAQTPPAADVPASSAPAAAETEPSAPEEPAQSAAPAAEGQSCGEELTWRFDNGTLTISGSGAMTDFTLLEAPWDLAGQSIRTERLEVESGVTYLGSYAFAACCNLREVSLPDTLTAIGSFAFADCVELRSVEFPASLLAVGASAFSGTGLESLELPYGAAELGERAFTLCSGLREVTLPDTLCSIGEEAFAECAALQEIRIKTGSLSEALLSEAGLGELLVSDGEASDLSEMIWSGSSQGLLWQLRDGELTLNGSGAMPDYSAGGSGAAPWAPLSARVREIRVNSGITTLGSYAFWSCAQAVSISLPDGLTAVGDYALGACEALETLELPGTVTSLGDGVCSCCLALREVTLPEGLTSIGEGAFQLCAALEGVYLPASLQSIGPGAFEPDIALSAPQGSYAEGWLRENGRL